MCTIPSPVIVGSFFNYSDLSQLIQCFEHIDNDERVTEPSS